MANTGLVRVEEGVAVVNELGANDAETANVGDVMIFVDKLNGHLGFKGVGRVGKPEGARGAIGAWLTPGGALVCTLGSRFTLGAEFRSIGHGFNGPDNLGGKMPAKRERGWCFTSFNWTEKTIEALNVIECRYILYGKEICPKTKKPHLQGYIYLDEGKTMSAIKALLWIGCDSPRMAVAHGTAGENYVYTGKEGDQYERGRPPAQGKRKDIDEIREIIDEGGSLLDCYEANFALTTRSSRGFKEYMQLKERQRDFKPQVHWRWGATGLGKSSYVWENWPIDKIYPKPAGSKFPHYNQSYDVVLIDDFDPKDLSIREFLRITDRYPCLVDVMYGYCNLVNKVFVITSDSHPSTYWDKKVWGQVSRRITSVTHVEWWTNGVLTW